MSRTKSRGLHAVTRQDGFVLLRAHSAPSCLSRLPDCRLLTLTPAGAVTAVLPHDALPVHLPPTWQIRQAVSVITAAGDCMGAAENRGRRLCAAAAYAGIALLAVSCCDLALAVAVPTADAARTAALFAETEPLIPGVPYYN